MEMFVQGAVAGYGIAIPVGAVSVLIMQLASRRGFVVGAFAGFGTASADLVYALIAVLSGAAVTDALAPISAGLKVVAACVLFAIAIRGLVAAARPAAPIQRTSGKGLLATYTTFLAITMLNPATIAYFAALVLGLRLADDSWGARGLFVAGAFLASASWQLVVAGAGVGLHRALGDRGRVVTGVAGSVVIAGLAVYTLVR